MRGGISRAGAQRGTLRLIVPALLCWACTIPALVYPGHTKSVWGILAVAALAAVTALVSLTLLWRAICSRHRVRLLAVIRIGLTVTAVFLAATLLVFTRILQLETGRHDPHLVQAAETGSTVTIEGTLKSFPKAKLRGQTELGSETRWLFLTAKRVTDHTHNTHQVREAPLILVWLDDKPPEHFGPGTSIQVTGRLEASQPSDMSAFTISAFDMTEHQAHSIFAAIGQGFAHTRSTMHHAAAQTPGASLVPGFALGDTSLVTEELNAAMLESSLTHLTAVSGANCALVIAACIWVCSYLRVPRLGRIFIAAAGLAAFVALIGPDSSVQRAAAMATVMLVGAFGNRRSRALNALAVAVIAMLVVQPWQALQPGFQLSVAATLGILIFAPRLSTWAIHRRLPKVLALPLAVSVAAQFACAPLLLLLQPGISISGIPANVFAAPLAPLGTGLGLGAALTLPVLPRLGQLVLFISTIPARGVEIIAKVSQHIPFGRLEWPGGIAGAVVLASLQLLGLLVWALKTGRLSLPFSSQRATRVALWQGRGRLPPRIRFIVVTGTAVLCAVFTSISVVSPVLRHTRVPNDWLIVACDVGQGDAILVRDTSAPHHAILIDTGADSDLLEECLNLFSVKTLTLVILTHDDHDHVGALSTVTHMTDAALIAPPVGSEPAPRKVVTQLQQAGIPYRFAAAGDAGFIADGRATVQHNADVDVFPGAVHDKDSASQAKEVQFTVLQPYPDKVYTDTNASSIVVRFDMPRYSLLALGDTGKSEHIDLLEIYPSEVFDVDVLKVAHHGSRDAEKQLTDAVGPRWSLISVGADNSYGHPALETLRVNQQVGAQILRTDLHGSIALTQDSKNPVWVEYSNRESLTYQTQEGYRPFARAVR